MHIGPEICYEPFDRCEGIGALHTLKMPVIALASLVVIPNLANPWPTIEERVLEAVGRRWNRSWNSPKNHFNDGAVVVVHSPVIEQLGFHLALCMALYAIWHVARYPGRGLWSLTRQAPAAEPGTFRRPVWFAGGCGSSLGVGPPAAGSCSPGASNADRRRPEICDADFSEECVILKGMT